MNPQLSTAAIALLFGAAKIGLIGTVGFAIAWFRAGARIRQLERNATRQREPELAERMDRMEQTLEYVAGQLDRIAETRERLPPPDR